MDLSLTRNLGLLAHMDAGKTTATERLLALADAACPGSAPGDVDLLTITSAATSCVWRGHALNVIDTPGQVDFTLDVERALRVLDGAVALFSGVAGVEAQSETFWRLADTYRVPRVAFVNKLDREGADFDRVVEAMALRLGATVLPLQVPVRRDGALVGLIDLVAMRYVRFDGVAAQGVPADEAAFGDQAIPVELLDLARARRDALLDILVEFDDDLGTLVASNGEVPVAQLKRSIRGATLGLGVVPVLGGAAFTGCGVAQLLDAVVDYLPSPADVPAVQGSVPGSPRDTLSRRAEAEVPLAALSFRVITDREHGPLCFVRVYSGVLEAGDRVLNPRSGRLEVVRGLTKILSTRRVALDRAAAGDIVGVAGLETAVVGDTLCAPEAPVVLASLDVPPAVVATRVTCEAPAVAQGVEADCPRLEAAVLALAGQDPSLRHRVLPHGGAVELEGVSEAHLDVVVARLRREFGLSLTAEHPRVACRETLSRPVDVLVREGGGVLGATVEPAERGHGCRVENRLPGDDVGCYRRLELALGEALDLGGLRGFPLVDVTVAVTEALVPVDASDEVVERLAGRLVERALREGGTVVQEPVMRVEVVTPEEHLGSVLGELTTMRGHVKRIESRGSIRALAAYVPLSEVGAYPERLRRLSGGQANFSMQFAYYERRPAEFADALEVMSQ